MANRHTDSTSPIVTGIGVATAFGFGKDALRLGLYAPRNVFGEMRRPGRQCPGGCPTFLGAEMPDPPALLPPRVARTASLTGRIAVAVIDEAWREAGLGDVDPESIGLVIGGSNLQARDLLLTQQAAAGRLRFLSPHYGYGFLDTDICGLCASAFPIRGFSHTVGGGSASGLLAVLHAAEAVRSGRVHACIAVGALQDLSYYECQGLRALGAMGSDRFAATPERACRPFDRDRDGFIYGESSAALVVARSDLPGRTSGSYGAITGGAHIADGNRGPEPSLSGEVRAIRLALQRAGLDPNQVDYVNAHGTGSPLGDDTELTAYREIGLAHAKINATKSIVGHGLSAAGAVELAAVFLQMREGRLHATRNLDTPIDPTFQWVPGGGQQFTIQNALKVSFGFGGIDAAVVVRALETS
jgi:malonyl-ACP decarboxylase